MIDVFIGAFLWLIDRGSLINTILDNIVLYTDLGASNGSTRRI